MMTGPAFNALLKTLEEPPAHVKFVFATTEIRKVPVTVLSALPALRSAPPRRRRPDQALHRRGQAESRRGRARRSGAHRAGRRRFGARRGCRWLDQAIARAEGAIPRPTCATCLAWPIALSCSTSMICSWVATAKGALGLMPLLYAAGAIPPSSCLDLLELTHWLTRIQAGAAGGRGAGRTGGRACARRAMAGKLTLPHLAASGRCCSRASAKCRPRPCRCRPRRCVMIRLTHRRRPADAGRSRAAAAGRRRFNRPSGRDGLSLPERSPPTTTATA